MKSNITIGVAMAAFAFSSPLLAADPQANAGAAPPPEATADSTAEAGAAAAAAFTDEELERYAQAAVEVHKINAETAMDAAAKQAGMAKAVEARQLTSARFNEISQASQKDPALLAKIQQAAARVQTAGTASANSTAAADATASEAATTSEDTAATGQ